MSKGFWGAGENDHLFSGSTSLNFGVLGALSECDFYHTCFSKVRIRHLVFRRSVFSFTINPSI